MIEVVALMIGEIVQCYSEERYSEPLPVVRGMFLKKGCPKSLYRPGSSTNVLLFQKGRIRFAEDLVANMHTHGVESRFASGLGNPLVETDVKVRSLIATIAGQATSEEHDPRIEGDDRIDIPSLTLKNPIHRTA